jgi:hypothetical protein
MIDCLIICVKLNYLEALKNRMNLCTNPIEVFFLLLLNETFTAHSTCHVVD